jgi:hypothetical protein
MMVCGGVAIGANQSLKGNRALLPRKEKGKFSLVSSINENWVDPKQSTPEQLLEIRNKIRKQQRIRRIKVSIATVLSSIGIVITIYLFTGN